MASIFPKKVLRRLREMRAGTTLSISNGLRNALSTLRTGFYSGPVTPALQDTKINKDKARALYYNTDPVVSNGAFVARNIVDGTSDYIGLPVLSVQDEGIDDQINAWVRNHWAAALLEMYRHALRDADCWVRIRLPFPSPLLGPGEDKIPTIEVYDSDRVTPYYNPATSELERVEILTDVYMEDSPFDPLSIYATGVHPYGREHEIIEVITKDTFTYIDNTRQTILTDYTTNNDWGFVPMIQVFNDYDSALHGGSSDLETVAPLFQPLHDLMIQTRTSHGYHSDPKVQVAVKDVMNFIRNNFPDSIVNGEFTGKVSWRDRDVFFMESGTSGEQNEAISFVTANLNTADSVSLMEIIIDFMCIAAGVTEGILFRAKAEGSTSSDEAERFKAKINRKRINLAPFIQRMVQMAMYVALKAPQKPSITWSAIDLQDEIDASTAFANVVTALELLNRSRVLSRSTYRASVRKFVPAMKNDQAEEQAAQAEAVQENQQQIDLQTQLNAVSAIGAGGSSSNGTKLNGGGGPNSGRRLRLPIDVLPTKPGN